MASKFKRVKIVIEDPATGEVRTFKSNRTTLASDCPENNPLKQRVVTIRRKLSWKKLAKLRVKVI